MTNPTTKVTRLSDFIIEEVSLVDRPANKRRFLQFKRDNNEADMPTDNITLQQAADGSFVTPATETPEAAPTVKGIESVEQIFMSVGEAVDRLMRVASVTLQADALKLDSGPNASTVVAEIEAVQGVLNKVKESIAEQKAMKSAEPVEPAKSEPEVAPVTVAAQSKSTPGRGDSELAQLAAKLEAAAVSKAGAAMSAGRLQRFTNALSSLSDLLSEVGGDDDVDDTAKREVTAKSVESPATDLSGEVAELKKQIAVLNREPAPSQSITVEKSNTSDVQDDFVWDADMNNPLGPNDVPVEKSFY